jgi:hypothetical protein
MNEHSELILGGGSQSEGAKPHLYCHFCKKMLSTRVILLVTYLYNICIYIHSKFLAVFYGVYSNVLAVFRQVFGGAVLKVIDSYSKLSYNLGYVKLQEIG